MRSVDAGTVAAYDAGAADYARDWLAQPAPADMYALLARHFIVGGVTVDVGCGAGRDTAWLAAQGFAARGVDVSAGLLEEARKAYPGIAFEAAGLPGLEGIADAACDNVLCETVIMHLPPAEVAGAVKGLTRVLKAGGVLYLSWRVSEGEGSRDKAGRLYAGFEAAMVRGALPEGEMLLDQASTSESSGKTIHRVVFRKA